ncbi:MAG TPA: hypothetical protein PK514_03035 [Spirochaetota bacterium]|nr:hypothetical protein [Spirochaetota bacterium]
MKLNSLINSLIVTGLIALAASACGVNSLTTAAGTSSVTPGVPSRIGATQGTLEDSVIIDWDGVEDAEYYIIYKAIGTPESFKVIESRVLKLSYIDPAPSGVTCYYKIAAGNGSNWSDPSSEVMGFALDGVLMPPASFTIPSSEIGQITLTWDAALMAVSYNIYRCELKYGTYSKINTAPVTGLTFTNDILVVPDTTYYYKIASVNSAGVEGPYSEIISGIALQQIPVVPINVTATDGTYGEKVMVTWTASLNTAYYQVYRATIADGTYELIADNVTGTEYADRSLVDGSTMYYKVKAVSSGGASDFSEYNAGNIDPSKPALLPPPIGVRASKGKNNLVTVSWDAVAGASGYTVYRSTSSNGTYTAVAGADPNQINPAVVDGRVSYDNSVVVTAKTFYYYKITTWSQSGAGIKAESEMSLTAAEGYTIPAIPDVPSGITMAMNHTSGSLTLAWAAAARATSYNVYRSDDGSEGTYNIVSTGQTALTHIETTADSIEAGVEYYYKIEAVNDGGKSVQTDYKGGIILGVPGNLAFTYTYVAFQGYKITVTWAAVPGATGYRLELATGGSPDESDWSATTISNGATTQYIYTGQGTTKTYNFRIRALNTDGNATGEFSGVVKKYLP